MQVEQGALVEALLLQPQCISMHFRCTLNVSLMHSQCTDAGGARSSGGRTAAKILCAQFALHDNITISTIT
eukprot:1160180-Pelagomonas_calceolata.AAC.2